MSRSPTVTNGHWRSATREMIALLVVIVGLGTTPIIAADARSASAPDPTGVKSWPGPIIDGRHRQPTQAEITAREQAKGRSGAASESAADLARRGLGKADLQNNSATNPTLLDRKQIGSGASVC
jgi:hypothetical protein